MSTFSNIEFKAIPGQFNIDEAQGIVECFVAGIGNKDSVGDVLVSGAFSKSLQRRKPRVVWGHNWNDPIGKVLEIYEVAPGDKRLPMKMLTAGIGGLYAKVQFNLNSEKGKEAFANVAFFGQEQEWSIGYKTLDSIFDPNIQANVLKEVELYEVSPVLHGANQLTGTISVKSDTDVIEEKAYMMPGMGMGMGNPSAGRPSGMMVRRGNPNIGQPGIDDDQKNSLEMELSVRAGCPVKIRTAGNGVVVFDRMVPGGNASTYRVAYHFTGNEYMFGKPQRIAAQTVFAGDDDPSGSRVVIPSQMPSMPMYVKPQENAYYEIAQTPNNPILPKWDFDEDFLNPEDDVLDSLNEKIGKTISTRNMAKLRSILESLQEIINTADKEVETKTGYVIPVEPVNAFKTKQLLDPIFDYHRVESHVTENGIVITSGVTQEFLEAVGVAEKALGRSLAEGRGKVGAAARAAFSRFDPNAWDGDGDGIIQDGTPYERPAIPGVNDRATNGIVDALAATRAWEQMISSNMSGLNADMNQRAGTRGSLLATNLGPNRSTNSLGLPVNDLDVMIDYMNGMDLSDIAKKHGFNEPSGGKYQSGLSAVRNAIGREQARIDRIMNPGGDNKRVYGNTDLHIMQYRARGLGAKETALLFGMDVPVLKKREKRIRQRLAGGEISDEELFMFRRNGVTLGQISKLTGIPDTKLRQQELAASRKLRNAKPEGRGLASSVSRTSEAITPDLVGEFDESVENVLDRAARKIIGKGNPINASRRDGSVYTHHQEEYDRILRSMKDILSPIAANAEDEGPGAMLSQVRKNLVDKLSDENFIESFDSREELNNFIEGIHDAVDQHLTNKFQEVKRTRKESEVGDFEELISELQDDFRSSIDRVSKRAEDFWSKRTQKQIVSPLWGRSELPLRNEEAKRDSKEMLDDLIKALNNGLQGTIDEDYDLDFASWLATRDGLFITSDTKEKIRNGEISPESLMYELEQVAERIQYLDPSREPEDIVNDLRKAIKNGGEKNPTLKKIADDMGDEEIIGGDLINFLKDKQKESPFNPKRGGAEKEKLRGLASRSDGGWAAERRRLQRDSGYGRGYSGPSQSWYEPPDPSQGEDAVEGMSVRDIYEYNYRSWDDRNQQVGYLFDRWSSYESGSKESTQIVEDLTENLDDMISRIESMKILDSDDPRDSEQIKILEKLKSANPSERKKIVEKLIDDASFNSNKDTDEGRTLESLVASFIEGHIEEKYKDSELSTYFLERTTEDLIEDINNEEPWDPRADDDSSFYRGLRSTLNEANKRRSEGLTPGTGESSPRRRQTSISGPEPKVSTSSRDEAIFKKLRDIGMSDEEIEILTGVPNGGRKMTEAEAKDELKKLNELLDAEAEKMVARGAKKISKEEADKILREGMRDGTVIVEPGLRSRIQDSSPDDLDDMVEEARLLDLDMLERYEEIFNDDSYDDWEPPSIAKKVGEEFGVDGDEAFQRIWNAKRRKASSDKQKEKMRSGKKWRELKDEDLIKEYDLIHEDSGGIDETVSQIAQNYGVSWDDAFKRIKNIENEKIQDDLAEIEDRQFREQRLDRGGLRSRAESGKKEMDMTLEEYGQLTSTLEKYVDDSQISGVGADEDIARISKLMEKIDDSHLANDSIPLTDDEIDQYVESLGYLKNNEDVSSEDSSIIDGLIDSLKKTKNSSGSYESEKLKAQGTRLGTSGGTRAAKPGRKLPNGNSVRGFRSRNGTVNTHDRLDFELQPDEVGELRDEISSIVKNTDKPEPIQALSEKLKKANESNNKFSVDKEEYEAIVDSIERAQSDTASNSRILDIMERAADSNDGKFSSFEVGGRGLRSENGKKSNNGAPSDINEKLQKELIFWARRQQGLRIARQIIEDYDKNDGEIKSSQWRALRTMYESMGPGSARGGKATPGLRSIFGKKRKEQGEVFDFETGKVIKPGEAGRPSAPKAPKPEKPKAPEPVNVPEAPKPATPSPQAPSPQTPEQTTPSRPRIFGGKQSAIPKVEDLKRTGGRLGSQDGAQYTDPKTGKKYYIKKPHSELHGESEVLTSKLMKLLGVGGTELDFTTEGGQKRIGSEIIQLGQGRPSDPAFRSGVQDMFVTLAWIANWDATENSGNIVSDSSGNPIVVDHGGGLIFRARGGEKGRGGTTAFGPKVGEMYTLRDQNINSGGWGYFRDITPKQISDQVAKLSKISDKDIEDLVGSTISDKKKAKEISDTLIARKNDIVKNWSTGKDASQGLRSGTSTAGLRSGVDDSERTPASTRTPRVSSLGDIGRRYTERERAKTGDGLGEGAKGKVRQEDIGKTFEEVKPEKWEDMSIDEKWDWWVNDPGAREMSEVQRNKMSRILMDEEEAEEDAKLTPGQRAAKRRQRRLEEMDTVAGRLDFEERATRTQRRQEEEATSKKPKKIDRQISSALGQYEQQSSQESAKQHRETVLEALLKVVDKHRADITKKSETSIGRGDSEDISSLMDADEESASVAKEHMDVWDDIESILGEDFTYESLSEANDALSSYVSEHEDSTELTPAEKLSVTRANEMSQAVREVMAKFKKDKWVGDKNSSSDSGLRSTVERQQNPKVAKSISKARSAQSALREKRSTPGLRSTGLRSSAGKTMITDEATFFKEVEDSMAKEIREAEKAQNAKAAQGLRMLQAVIKQNEASKLGNRRTNVGSIYVTADEADVILEGLVFSLDRQMEKGGEKRVAMFSKLLDKIAQAAMSTFIDKETSEITSTTRTVTNQQGRQKKINIVPE